VFEWVGSTGKTAAKNGRRGIAPYTIVLGTHG
jgi:hypothetical protein